MNGARYAIGIDLGTTHTALAFAGLDETSADVRVFGVPQLVDRGSLLAEPLLPSFLYFAHESGGAVPLPWDASRSYAVGTYARARAAESPARVVSSAKSWLSHAGVDRRSGLLPQGAPADIEKVSPVEASFRYLDHLVEAWRAASNSGVELGEQEVILTVPASFDAAARDLTVEAAYAAGLENVTLLEEPQAALYAWIEAAGEAWRQQLSPGDVVLVIDIGGGTTDFSAIAAVERDGNLELHRIAVGDHILLGGDNMDLALAHVVATKLAAEGKTLDRFQLVSLGHACRAAKERLLSNEPPDSVPIAIASRGSQLLGGTLRTELTRADVERTLVEGFFPIVPASARPAQRARVGLTQLGLPYAADPGVTKHLAAFLSRQAGALRELVGESAASATLLRPTAILFNGGVVKAPLLRARLIETLNAWLQADGAAPARVLSGDDPDLAVARGAAYYGAVRRGRGLRIRGGTARAYYVGIESPMPAVPGIEPPITAFCVAPFGVEEGSEIELPAHELGVVVGEPVSFRFFGSSVRRQDGAGTALEYWSAGEIEELSPISVTLPPEGRNAGDVVPVRVRSSITPVGTLLLEAIPLEPRKPDEHWKLELSVRGGEADHLA
jgi:molecular chaperone DnaK (HSP70)